MTNHKQFFPNFQLLGVGPSKLKKVYLYIYIYIYIYIYKEK